MVILLRINSTPADFVAYMGAVERGSLFRYSGSSNLAVANLAWCTAHTPIVGHCSSNQANEALASAKKSVETDKEGSERGMDMQNQCANTLRRRGKPSDCRIAIAASQPAIRESQPESGAVDGGKDKGAHALATMARLP